MTASDHTVALDSNLLLLYLVSRDQRLLNLIGSWKRLNTFTSQDAVRLSKLVYSFRSLVTTPHVLTETSNFIGQLLEPLRSILLDVLKTFLGDTIERLTAAQILAHNEAYLKLRLTDCALLELPHGCTLLTVDFHLAAQRKRNGGLGINFRNEVT